MLTFNQDIYKNILKVSGVKYGPDLERNYSEKYIIPDIVEEVWCFVFPRYIRDIMGLTSYSRMNQGTDDFKNGTNGKRETIKGYINSPNSEALTEMRKHLSKLVKENAAIELMIRNGTKGVLSYQTIEKFIQNNKLLVEEQEAVILSKIGERIQANLGYIRDDSRIPDELQDYIRNNYKSDTLRVIEILIILSLFTYDDSDKDFYERVKYIYCSWDDKQNEERVVQGCENTEFDELESCLLNSAKELIEIYETKQKHEIDSDLLASCTVKGQDYANLYEYMNNAISQQSKNNCMLQATGGSGKTSSLIYMCKRFMEEKDSVIPIFVQMGNLDGNHNKPVLSYLINICADNCTYTVPQALEEQFLIKLRRYLRNSDKLLLIVLDGCNEGPENRFNGINDILGLPNTLVVVSSRLREEKIGELLTVKLHSIDKNTTSKYLSKFNIELDNLEEDTVKLPMFLYMFVQICHGQTDTQDILVHLVNQAAIINEWILSDIKKNKEIKKADRDVAGFAVEFFLPLLAMEIFFNTAPQKHNSLLVSVDSFVNAIGEVENVIRKLLNNPKFELNIKLKKKLNNEDLSKDSLLNILNSIIVDQFAFLQNADDDNYLFSWAHECYRDWFIAKGMDILRIYCDGLSNEYMTRFIEEAFRYPAAYREYKDYSAYSVAVFYAELVREDVLTNINDINYHNLIRNIAFFADDIGNTKNVLDYAEYMLKRDRNENIHTPKYQKAKALSGMGYSLLHIYNLNERADKEKIIDSAKEMLFEAKRNIEELIGYSFDEIDINSDENMELNPEQLCEYYKEIIELQIVNLIDSASQRDEMLELDCFEVIACLARIYGNCGLYYTNRFDETLDHKMLIQAHRSHLIGGLIKQYIYDKRPDVKVAGMMPSVTLSISYRSLGIDLYRAKKYKESIEYFEYAKKNFEMDDVARMKTDASIVRSKISDMLTSNMSESLSNIICEEKKIIEYFRDKHSVGEIERIKYVIADIITVCKLTEQSSETEELLAEVIYLLGEVFDAFYLEDNISNNMISYWKKNGENLWVRSFNQT